MLVSYFSENNKTCQTPKQISGECKHISTCPSLFSILQHRPIDSINADFLSKSKCDDTDPQKVCCPLSHNKSLQPIRMPGSGGENKGDGMLTNLFYYLSILKAQKLIVSEQLPDHEICGIDSPSKIFGGNVTDIREFPWLVLIENKYGESIFNYKEGYDEVIFEYFVFII